LTDAECVDLSGLYHHDTILNGRDRHILGSRRLLYDEIVLQRRNLAAIFLPLKSSTVLYCQPYLPESVALGSRAHI
jgi:hypothetical protein